MYIMLTNILRDATSSLARPRAKPFYLTKATLFFDKPYAIRFTRAEID